MAIIDYFFGLVDAKPLLQESNVTFNTFNDIGIIQTEYLNFTNVNSINFEGNGSFNGFTYLTDTIPLECELKLIDVVTNNIVLTTTSSVIDGSYSFEGIDQNRYYDIVARPINGNYEKKIVSNKQPSQNSYFNLFVYDVTHTKNNYTTYPIKHMIKTIGNLPQSNIQYSIVSDTSGVLSVDSNGLITGNIQNAGSYTVVVNAHDVFSSTDKSFTLNFVVTQMTRRVLPLSSDIVDIINSETWSEVNGSSVFFNNTLAVRNQRHITSNNPITLDGDFTLTCRFKADNLTQSAYPTIFATGQSSSDGNVIFLTLFSPTDSTPARRNKLGFRLSTTLTLYTISDIEPFRAYEVRVVRENGVIYLFLNGQVESFGTDTTSRTAFLPLRIGANVWDTSNGGAWFNGFISDFELVKLSLGTSNYTPTKLPDKTAYYEHKFNTLTDEQMLTYSGNFTFNNGVYIFDGNNSPAYVTIPNNIVAFGTSNFTIELEFKKYTTKYMCILDNFVSGSNGWQVNINSNNNIEFYVQTAYVFDKFIFSDNVDYYIKIVRNGNYLTLIVNDSPIQTILFGSNINLSAIATYFAVGGQYSNRNSTLDYIGEVKYLKFNKGINDGRL